MKYFFLVLTFLIVLSCNNKIAKINVTTFELSEIPSSLYGCSCLFSNSKEEYESGKYIYFDDFGDNSLISINNEVIYLKKENGKYKNDYFTVFVQNKIQVGKGYESTTYKAELVIVDENDNKNIYIIYGLCGC